jgi:hypothetical protein
MRNWNNATPGALHVLGLCLAIAFALSSTASGREADDAKAVTDAIKQQITKYLQVLYDQRRSLRTRAATCWR